LSIYIDLSIIKVNCVTPIRSGVSKEVEDLPLIKKITRPVNRSERGIAIRS
jgi:hypothetical protein